MRPILGGLCALFAIAMAPAAMAAAPKLGTYGCSSSTMVGGVMQFSPKGSFTLKAGGAYSYQGFEKPSAGKYAAYGAGKISFTGGYFDKGEAAPVEGYQDRFRVVFPTIPDRGWNCTLK